MKTTFFLLALLNSFVAFAQTSLTIKTGNYDETVDLSFDKKSGIISGIIARSNYSYSEGPKISCTLLFRSSPQAKANGDNKYQVNFYNEGDTAAAGKGHIQITKGGITIKCYGSFSNCNLFMELSGDGEDFAFTTATPFISAKTIKKPTAAIYKSPADSSKSKMYLVKDNFISVISITDKWVSFEYVNPSGKRIKGWLKKEEVAL